MARSTAAEVRARVVAAPAGSFIHVADLPGSRRAVESAMSRLESRLADLVRVRRGLYWTADHAGPPHPVAVAIHASRDRGVGPTGWLAAWTLGVSPACQALPELVVVGGPPTGLTGVRLRSRSNYSRLRLAYVEIALLELLREVPRWCDGGWPAVVAAAEDLVGAGAIALPRVAAVAEDERHVVLRSNCERLLRQLSDAPARVTPAVERPLREVARGVATRVALPPHDGVDTRGQLVWLPRSEIRPLT